MCMYVCDWEHIVFLHAQRNLYSQTHQSTFGACVVVTTTTGAGVGAGTTTAAGAGAGAEQLVQRFCGNQDWLEQPWHCM